MSVFKASSLYSPGGLIKNWSLLTIASLVQTVLGFLCTVRLARVLDASQYGRYTLVITVVGMLQIISALSIRNVAIREISRNRSSMLPIARISAVLMTAATVICSFLLSGYLVFESDLHEMVIIISAVVLLAANTVWTYAETLAFAIQDMYISSALNIIGSVLWLMMVFLAPVAWLTVEYSLAAFAAVQMFRGFAYLLFEVRKKYFVSEAVGPASALSATEILKQSLPILGSAALAIPVVQLPLMFLARFSGMAEVGYYGVGSKLTQPIALISTTLFQAIYPRISGSYTNDPRVFRKQSETFFFVLMAASFFFAVLSGLFSREIIIILFGAQYERVIAPFSAQVWMVSIWVLNNYFGSLLLASNNEKGLLYISVVNSLLIGIASYAGAFYGTFGLAVSSLISCIVTFVGYHWYIQHAIPGILGSSAVMRAILLLIISAGVTVMFSTFPFTERITIFVAITLSAYLLHRDSIPVSLAEFRAKLRGV